MDPHLTNSRRSRVPVVTPAQIVALGLVAASIGWAAWLLQERPTADEVALLEDTTLTAPQLAAIEAALDRANLTDYRTADGTVWVPRSRQGAYKRAVVDGDAIPKPWGTRFHEAIASGGVWTSTSARAESLKVALQDELSQVLCSMPGIERAAVLYDVEERSGFQQEPLKTASVGIRTTSGTELDAVRAHGIRVLVASSIAGLEPERVAVTDLSTGRVFAGALARLASLDSVVDGGTGIRASGHHVRFAGASLLVSEAITAAIGRLPLSPPTLTELTASIAEVRGAPSVEEVVGALVATGALVKVSEEVYFDRNSFDEMVTRVDAHFRIRGEITVAEARDLIGTSRKYVLPFLEYLDREKVTRRNGDLRLPGSRGFGDLTRRGE